MSYAVDKTWITTRTPSWRSDIARCGESTTRHGGPTIIDLHVLWDVGQGLHMRKQTLLIIDHARTRCILRHAARKGPVKSNSIGLARRTPG